MDGMHRICIPVRPGGRYIQAVQFTADPEPDLSKLNRLIYTTNERSLSAALADRNRPSPFLLLQ